MGYGPMTLLLLLSTYHLDKWRIWNVWLFWINGVCNLLKYESKFLHCHGYTESIAPSWACIFSVHTVGSQTRSVIEHLSTNVMQYNLDLCRPDSNRFVWRYTLTWRYPLNVDIVLSAVIHSETCSVLMWPNKLGEKKCVWLQKNILFQLAIEKTLLHDGLEVVSFLVVIATMCHLQEKEKNCQQTLRTNTDTYRHARKVKHRRQHNLAGIFTFKGIGVLFYNPKYVQLHTV